MHTAVFLRLFLEVSRAQARVKAQRKAIMEARRKWEAGKKRRGRLGRRARATLELLRFRNQGDTPRQARQRDWEDEGGRNRADEEFR
eukprot:7209052-Alexandrium_andersonii.AAC.1